MKRRLIVIAVASLVVLPVGGAARGEETAPEAVCTPIGPAPFGGPDLGTCTGARPGSRVNHLVNPAFECTLNFVFQGGDGYRYIGTAGHCVTNGPTRAWEPGQGPEASSRGTRIGEYAYGAFGGSHDFGLVRLDPDVAASPEMCHFGGPTAVFTSLADEPKVLHHYGNGKGMLGLPVIPLGTLSPARSGVANTTSNRAYVDGNLVHTGGDSGSPVITADGEAVGVLVATVVDPDNGGGIARSTRISNQLARAESALGTTLTLLTAPLR